MGRKRINPLTYKQITEQTEKTMRMLMKAAHIKTNSEATKEQCVSRAFGAFALWEDLTRSNTDTEDDNRRLFSLLVVEEAADSRNS